MKLPESGTPREELFAKMREMKGRDADWRSGRTWSLIYPAGEDVDDVLREANNPEPGRRSARVGRARGAIASGMRVVSD